MNKLKLFVKNMVVYGLGGVISKIIPLVMVPIVTRIMPNSEYFGISDLANTLLSLCSSLGIMGMYDAMYRMFFEKEDEEYKKEICSTAFFFTCITSVILFVMMIVFSPLIAKLFFGDKELINVVYIVAMATLIGATNGIMSAPTRMQNKGLVFVVLNTIGPVISYSISIPLLLHGYYVIALPIAGLITAIIYEIVFYGLNRKWFNLKMFKKEHIGPLIKIGLPLLPNFLIYWLFNSSDRLMITSILGIGAAGLYSVGSKLGHASQIIYTAFSGGWQYFAFATMKEEEQVRSNTLVFEYLGVISFAVTTFVCCFSRYIYAFLFEQEYYESYVIAPYLFLAPLLQMLFQIAANQFIVIKKTWPNAFILFLGSAVNIVLNLVLIPVLGIEGAAIATLIGYALSDVICVIVLQKMKLMKISVKFIFATILLIAFFVLWRIVFVEKLIVNIIMAIAFCIVMIILYMSDIKSLFVKNNRK